jgi:hypothetical protein
MTTYNFNPYNTFEVEGGGGADSSSSSSSASSEQADSPDVCGKGGADNRRKPKNYQAYVVIFNARKTMKHHYLTLRATTLSGAASKAITRAVQRARGPKNHKTPYPPAIVDHIRKGEDTFVHIRAFKRGGPRAARSYVGNLIELDDESRQVDDKSPSINYKYKAKVYSLDTARSKHTYARLRKSAKTAEKVNQLDASRARIEGIERKGYALELAKLEFPEKLAD